MGISGFLRQWDERMDTLLATNVASRIRDEAALTDVERDLLVAAGEGATIAGDQEIHGSQRDVFAVPNWTWQQHLNRSKFNRALLFAVTPAVAARGFTLRAGMNC